MRTRVTVICLSVGVSVCYQSCASVRRSCGKMNLPDRSSLNSEVFNLAFSLKSSLSRVIACFLFCTAKPAAICNCQWIRRSLPKVHKSAMCSFVDYYLRVVIDIEAAHSGSGSKFGTKHFALQCFHWIHKNPESLISCVNQDHGCAVSYVLMLHYYGNNCSSKSINCTSETFSLL